MFNLRHVEPVPLSLFSSLFQVSEMSEIHTSSHTATCLDIDLPTISHGIRIMYQEITGIRLLPLV